MAAVVRTLACFPDDIRFGVLGVRPSEADHRSCSGGQTMPGVLGGWKCPCECHRPAPAVAPAPTDVAPGPRVGGASGATGFAKDNPVGAQFRPGRRGAGSARNGR